MANLRLSLSCNEYDRTRFLVDGTIKAEGIDLQILALPSEERHRRFSRELEFDACELQMGVFLGWIVRGAPFRAIPVFPHRKFCHGNVLVHAASDIQKPEDLAGKTIGMRAHFNPVSLWMRGILQDEYGVPARSLKLRTNQQEQVPGWEPPEWMDIERLKSQGFELQKLRNSWSDEQYKGINSQWIERDTGQRFEVQFHTRMSFEAKHLTHDAYERIRSKQADKFEELVLEAFQRKVAADVPVPSGATDIPDYPERSADAR